MLAVSVPFNAFCRHQSLLTCLRFVIALQAEESRLQLSAELESTRSRAAEEQAAAAQAQAVAQEAQMLAAAKAQRVGEYAFLPCML